MTSDGIERWTNDIHQGDVVETLQQFPESSIHTVVTSPPYWGLRDYDVDGQIGREESLEEYIETIVNVCREIRRVLRPDGSLWLNLGDSYATTARGNPDDDSTSGLNGRTQSEARSTAMDRTGQGIPEKCKLLVPQRVGIELIDDGWLVRNDVVWKKKGGGVPEPVRDRCSKSHEYVYHAAPADGYWYDTYAVDLEGSPLDDVWEIFPKPHPEAHFAVMPEELAERTIKLSTPPTVCATCGTPYEREIEEIAAWEQDRSTIEREQLKAALDKADAAGLTEEHLKACRAVGFSDAASGMACQTGAGNNDDRVEELAAEAQTVLGSYVREFTRTRRRPTGWMQACDCDTDDTKPGIVLDPFAGAGTTCLVGKQLGRRFAGIELNPEYVAMAQKRVGVTVDEPDRLLEDAQQTVLATAEGGDADR